MEVGDGARAHSFADNVEVSSSIQSHVTGHCAGRGLAQNRTPLQVWLCFFQSLAFYRVLLSPWWAGGRGKGARRFEET